MRTSSLENLGHAFRALRRWYFLELVAVGVLTSAILSGGLDRVLLLVAGGMAATVAVRLRYGDRSGWARLARAAQLIGGAVAMVAGIVLLAGGVFLATRGSFAVLAALVVVPLGAGVAILGFSLIRVGMVSGPDRQDPRPLDMNHYQEHILAASVASLRDQSRARPRSRVRGTQPE